MSADMVKTRVYRLPRPGGAQGSGGIWVWKCDACRKNRLGCAHRTIHPSGTWRAAMCGAFRHVHVEHRQVPGRAHTQLLHTVLWGRTRCDITRPSDTVAAAAWNLLQQSSTWQPAWAREAVEEIVALTDQHLTGEYADPHSTVRFAP